jgi:alkylation response protein AidB-like acyl-CoA dehydrogenase
MDFELNFEQTALQETLRSYLHKHCTKEYLDEVESAGRYPQEIFDGLGELGFLGVGVPEELGGGGGNMLELALTCEVIGEFGGSMVMTYVPTAVFGNQTLMGDVSPELRERFLPRMVKGELRTAFALTEPDAGSDAGALRTRAVPSDDRDEWILDGSKIWSTGAMDADYLVLSARTGSLEERSGGITVFLVDTKAAGLTMRPIPKLGAHAVASCEVWLDGVRVPADHVVGEVGRGWRALRRALDAERIAVAAICTGSAQRCLDLALGYGLERHQFGRPVASFQVMSHMLAEMATETAAARLLAYQAAWTMDRGGDATMTASMAKAFATEANTRTVSRAMQMFGGYSYSREFEIERYYREAKLYEIAGGATQILRNIIAGHLGVPSYESVTALAGERIGAA